MSSKMLHEINVKFPRTEKRLERSYASCKRRKKFVEVPHATYSKHLELAKDDLNSIKADVERGNWRWVITKAYYALFHATNALLVNKLGFFSKDHLCAVIALKQEGLLDEKLYEKLGNVYERFSDIFGFAIVFEARKISQYDIDKWRELTADDARVIRDFARTFVSFVEGACQ